MNKITLILTLFLSAILISNLSHAHHSSMSTFRNDKTSIVEGIVTEFRFRNPHVLIYLDVENPDGSKTSWVAEAGSASVFRRNGWTASTLKSGDVLRISGDATIDGSPMVWVDKIEYLDSLNGKVMATLDDNTNPDDAFSNNDNSQHSEKETISARPPFFIPLRLSTGEPNFTGTTSKSTSPEHDHAPDAFDPSIPYNEVGLMALEAWDIVTDPQVFCDPPGLVRQGGYTPHGQKIVQYPDHITIEYEEYGSKRAIFFDDELPVSGIRTHLGDSIARYEGETLIIETVNLAANASGHRGRPLSNQARVTEVFSRVEDPVHGSHLKITTTVHDPKFLTESWTINRIKAYKESYDFITNQCEPPLRPRPPNVWQEPS